MIEMNHKYYGQLKKAPVILLILLMLSSCEAPFFEPDPKDTPKSNFEHLWSTVDEKYSFFDFKGIDWDSIHTVYDLRIDDDMDDEELFYELFSMLNVLRDGHVNLWSPFDIARYEYIFYNSPANFNKTILEKNYLKTDYRITGSLINKRFGDIGYIYYSSFMNYVDDGDLDYILSKFSNTRGIVFDVRDNGGGSPSYIFTIASRFTKEKQLAYTSQLKNGPEHDNFTEPNKVYISPADKDLVSYHGKVVLLTNRYSYSATNMFTAVMKSLPNVTIMGDTTGGGGGAPIGGELPNGWYFRFSATKTLLPDGFNIEDGIPPDIQVNMVPEDEAEGIDTILEEAFKEIKK